MSNQMAEKLINFRVYDFRSRDLHGVADIKMPDIEAMTDTVKGAGIAGEVEVPVLGHYSAMQLGLNWRTMNESALALAAPKAHGLELRGAVQVFDTGAGVYKTVGQKIVLTVVPKKFSPGKMDVATGQETASEFEIHYIKIFLDGKEKFELDKYNYICKVDGVDYLADTRTALGL